MTRFRDWLNSLYFGTRYLLCAMVIIYIVQILFIDRHLMIRFCNIPRYVFQGQVWRLVTSVFMHGGFFHLFMNMMSFVQLGATLETRIGTVSFIYHIFLFSILASTIHCLIALFMYVGGNPSEFYTPTLGFSGVLFALMVIDNNLNEHRLRSVLGLFLVPSRLYPWVMLLVMQVILRNVSFYGHISGIFVGYMYNWGLLRWAVPNRSILQACERQLCVQSSGFVTTDGVDNGWWRPFAVFERNMRPAGDEENDVELEQQNDREGGNFQGRGRTIGDAALPAEL